MRRYAVDRVTSRFGFTARGHFPNARRTAMLENTTIAQKSEEFSVNEFDRVNLSCPVNLQGDLGDLNIEWRKSDVFLRAAKANRVQDAFHYVIPSANRKDAGIYECIVVSTIYGNMTVELRENIFIRGHPTPLLVVSRNGILATNASSLEILSSAEADAGTYCCNASNAAGRSNVTCLMLRVICMSESKILHFVEFLLCSWPSCENYFTSISYQGRYRYS